MGVLGFGDCRSSSVLDETCLFGKSKRGKSIDVERVGVM